MDDTFDEADAALVLTSISCSPPSYGFLSSSLPANVGLNRRAFKPENREKLFQCLWKEPKCSFTTTSQQEIGKHVRNVHLQNGRMLRGRRGNCESLPGDAMQVDGDVTNITEEDFYYTEVESDTIDNVVHSFRHLQTASPPDVPIALPTGTFDNSGNSPDSAYGSVPKSHTTVDHEYQKNSETQPITPILSFSGTEGAGFVAASMFSQSLPASQPMSFMSPMGLKMPPMGLEPPISETNNRSVPSAMTTPVALEAAFLSVLQRLGHSPNDDAKPADLSTSLPTNWLFPSEQLLSPGMTQSTCHFSQVGSGGGGVPFNVIAAAANAAGSPDPHAGYLSSSPPSTNSPSPPPVGSLPSTSSVKHRRIRSDVKKCRKVYGIEKREMWCTQCRWKKACTRFME